MERTVKLIRVNHPDEVKWVTPAAAPLYDKNKWIIDQPTAEVKKKGVEGAVIKRVIPNNVTEVAPVVLPEGVVEAAEKSLDVKEILRDKFKELSGTEADKRWNEGRLKIEIAKLQVNA